MLTLETERLILRDFLAEDWEALNAILIDPEVIHFMHFGAWDEEERCEWHAQLVQDTYHKEHDAFNWAITLRSTGELIGWFGIGGASYPVEEGDRSCGYSLNSHYRGQGYMPEAARAVIAYEFATLGTSRIFAECVPENTASARVMQKSGMIYDGTSCNEDSVGHKVLRYRYAIRKPIHE